MRFVAAIGGSILLQDYDAKRFQEYAEILKELSKFKTAAACSWRSCLSESPSQFC